MYNLCGLKFNKDSEKFAVHIRLTKDTYDYLSFLKLNYNVDMTEIVRCLVEKYKDNLLNSRHPKIGKRDKLLHIKVNSLEEKNFYNAQVKQNISFMLDCLRRNDMDYVKVV